MRCRESVRFLFTGEADASLAAEEAVAKDERGLPSALSLL